MEYPGRLEVFMKDLPKDCIIVGERIAEIWEKLCHEENTDPHTIGGVSVYCVATLNPSEMYGFGKGAALVDLLPSQEAIEKQGKGRVTFLDRNK